ncbi:MAG: serine hydroxymethyltransferase [Rickettsiales bacterium]|nr:serine hydroxymethyltransferase [Rickettsiales bacterium]
MQGIFGRLLAESDKDVFGMIGRELARQKRNIELIASENIVSPAVMEAMGSVLTNKYSEGYPGHRYYGGNEHIDEVETLCIERAKKLFGARFANVQPHSGAQANTAVQFALAKAGDTIMGMSLDAGGHLTHGARPTLSGKWFKSVQYGVDEDGLIDYAAAEKLATEAGPKIIIAGGSAYPRLIDFERFRKIADQVGARLMVDMAHFAGLVAAGIIPSPIGIADVVTTTTHKTLRGPRGGMILTNDEKLAAKIDKAVFPGIQGGPLEHVIAAKAVALGENLLPDWKDYALQVVRNIKALGDELTKNGFRLVSGGTDTHLILLDLRPADGKAPAVSGKEIADALDAVGITCNCNAVPGDPLPPSMTSGIRLGSPAVTTRGFMEDDMRAVGGLIARIIRDYEKNHSLSTPEAETVKGEVTALTGRYPIYGVARGWSYGRRTDLGRASGLHKM